MSEQQDLYVELKKQVEILEINFGKIYDEYYEKYNNTLDKIIVKTRRIKNQLLEYSDTDNFVNTYDEKISNNIIEQIKNANNRLETTYLKIVKDDLNSTYNILLEIMTNAKKLYNKTYDKIDTHKNKKEAKKHQTQSAIQNLQKEISLFHYSDYLKIDKLLIENYKNLSINVDLGKNQNLSVIIGDNGSGKSNLIEAISAIFAELYLSIPTNFNYSFVYEMNGKQINLSKNTQKKEYLCNNHKASARDLEENNLIPSKIIALYSGEETRLWDLYYSKSYKKWLKDTHKNNRMIYIDKNFWDIALLSLLLTDSPDHNIFIKEELNIKNIKHIDIEFNENRLAHIVDIDLKNLIEQINPLLDYKISLSLSEFKTKIANLDKYSIFRILTNAYRNSKEQIIKYVDIIFDEDISVKDLSEGEKKKILLKAVFDIVADENAIIILDEPDAHIHEKSKEILCETLEKYSEEYNRQIFITTHSPTIAHCIKDKYIIMLKRQNDKSTIIANNTKDKVKELTNGMWSEIEQNIFLSSNIPLVLTEGKGDINYIKKALKLFYNDYPLNLDFLPFGGTNNACEFINDIKSIAPVDKKIIVLFDRDDAGAIGMKKCINNHLFTQGKQNSNTYIKNGVIYLMLPKINGHNTDDFLIEDYFSIELKKEIAQRKIDEAKGFFNLYTKDLKGYIKTELSKEKYHTVQNMGNFRILLEKLKKIINSTEICIPVD